MRAKRSIINQQGKQDYLDHKKIYKECVCGITMETKGVKICEYCSKVIDPKGIFIQDIERDGSKINHEAEYHQECFINSMIKDLESSGFEVIRPRAEINKNLHNGMGIGGVGGDDLFDLNPKEIKTAMDMAAPMLDALFGATPKDTVPKDTVPKTTVSKRTVKPKIQNDEKKEQKKSVSTRKD